MRFSWAAIVHKREEPRAPLRGRGGVVPAWELVKDVVDEFIDLALNYRQSGHPGGSRSKVHLLLSTMLSGAMRWDIRRPWLPFGDRFVLSAGHTVRSCTPPLPHSTRRSAFEPRATPTRVRPA